MMVYSHRRVFLSASGLKMNLNLSIINSSIPFSPIGNCWDWCREQQLIHQGNQDIYTLVPVMIAIAMLWLHNFIGDHSDQLKELSGMDESQLTIVYEGTYYLSFFLLVIYLIYTVFF